MMSTFLSVVGVGVPRLPPGSPNVCLIIPSGRRMLINLCR